MKKFIINIFLFIFCFTLVYQVDYPLGSPFKLRSLMFSLIENQNKVIEKDKKILNRFNEKVEININNIGFNSHRNFYNDSISKNDIAIIGDSFVDSKIVGYDNSIAYNLEKLTQIKTYNFGVSGGNLNDYVEIYNKYQLQNINLVFIMLTGIEDLKFNHNFNDTLSIKLLNKFLELNKRNFKI